MKRKPNDWLAMTLFIGMAVAGFGGIAVYKIQHPDVYMGKWPYLFEQMQARRKVERPVVVLIRCGPLVGNGFVVGPDLVLTVSHVVPALTDVTVDNLDATFIKVDRNLDLALLRVPGIGTQSVQFAAAVLDEPVRIEGYIPWHRRPERVVYRGSVASVDFGDYILVGGASQPGLSGSPVTNARGQVIGIFAGVIGAFGRPNITNLIVVPASTIADFIEGAVQEREAAVAPAMRST